MAKKRKGKLKIKLSKPDDSNVVQITDNSLPTYHHFVDSPDHRFRLFFEEQKSNDEIRDEQRPNKIFLRKKSNHNPFWLMQDGKNLVGENIARIFSTLLSRKVMNGDVTNPGRPGDKEHTAISNFFTYLASLEKPPKQFEEINITHLSGWLAQVSKGSSATLKKALTSLLKLHPLSSVLDMNNLRCPHDINQSKELEEIDFDEIVKESDYSEKVHFQFSAFVYYEIELAEDRLKNLEEASADTLEEDYIPLNVLVKKNPTIERLLNGGEEGFKQIFYHYYLFIKDEASGIRKYQHEPNYLRFNTRLAEISKCLNKASDNPEEKIESFRSFCISSQPDNWSTSTGKQSPLFSYLSLTSKHHEVAILLYAIITLGVNKEVALSWKWEVNGRPWFENYDVDLGINHNSAPRDKKIVLKGIKSKGGNQTAISKSISVNSPLYRYLRFLDRTRQEGRKYIFKFVCTSGIFSAFCSHYPIIGDDGKRLDSIDTRKFRKSYIGYKTLKLLKGVNNADDLVKNLREALNHKSFDTTFSSYIMKSGMARMVIDSATVALTTEMLEEAMIFKGEIKEDNERSEESTPVFLCDCNDPSNPSHGLPIAEKCFKYDMCLGCERCEVYSEHLPAICYRIMEYEEKEELTPEIFNITLVDRLAIARDVVEKFKHKHSKGMEIVEGAYVIASAAMHNGERLLPPILSLGAK
jgi:hypothetical protein